MRLRSTIRVCCWFGLLVMCVIGAPVGAQETAGPWGDPDKADTKTITAAVEALGAAKFTTREAAQAWLVGVGEPALKALRVAAKGNDLEMAERATAVIESIELGVWAGADPEVLTMARTLRDGDQAKKLTAVQWFARYADGRGIGVLKRALPRETDTKIRQAITSHLHRQTLEKVTATILAGQPEAALADLAAASHAGVVSAFDKYASLALGMNELDGAIKQALALKDFPEKQLLLAHLYRADGQLELAQAAADKAGNTRMQQALWFDRGDWAALAAHLEARKKAGKLGGHHAPRMLAIAQAAAAGSTQPLAAFTKTWPEKEKAQLMEFYIVNGMVREAVDIAIAGQPARHMDLLVKAGRWDVALEQFKHIDSEDAPKLSSYQRRAAAKRMAGMGEPARGVALLKAGLTDKGSSDDQRLLGALWKMGQHKFVMERADSVIQWSKVAAGDRAPTLIRELYGGSADIAMVWLAAERARAGEDKPRFENVHLMMTRPPDELEPVMLEHARKLLETNAGKSYIDQRLAIASWFWSRDQQRPALAWMERLNPKIQRSDLWKVAQWHARRERWAAAALLYGRAAREHPTNLVYQWQWGWAMELSGQAQRGHERQRLAILATLTVPKQQPGLLRHMRHWDSRTFEMLRTVLLRTGWPREYYAESESARAGTAALRDGRYDEVIRRSVRFAIWLSENSVGAAHADLLRQAGDTSFARAQLALQQVNIEQAIEWGKRTVEAEPGRIDQTIALVEVMDRADQAKAADAVFAHAFKIAKTNADLLKKNAAMNNQAAWLAARCQRSMAEAQKLAERAVAAAPKYTAAIDTLAELHFQQGRTNQAIELMKRCIELEPNREYYRRQLARFESDDTTTVPQE